VGKGRGTRDGRLSEVEEGPLEVNGILAKIGRFQPTGKRKK
jgi:hypothetical protein